MVDKLSTCARFTAADQAKSGDGRRCWRDRTLFPAAVLTDVAKQVDGLIWKTEADRPDDDDGAAGALVPAN
ncbi:MAG TPA: hypothetical protein VNS49_17800 [Streptomyces sp.]|nr:hypothetical protein [Streptomyces sp.]